MGGRTQLFLWPLLFYNELPKNLQPNHRKKAKTETEQRITRKKAGEYFENHHIIPKCMGGTNNKDNIIILTAREHFLCHWLLHEIYPENKGLSYAFFIMCFCDPSKNKTSRYIPSSRIIEYAKIKAAEERKGIPTWIKGKHHSEETKQRMRESKIGTTGVNTGRKFNQEWKDKMKSSAKIGWEKRKQKGLITTEETKQKMRASKLGTLGPNTGKKFSEQTKQRMRESARLSWQKRKDIATNNENKNK